MGGGIREESDETRVWFTTSGYLLQFLSKSCDGLTHLVIDEAHQRSLEADLCCYLARHLSLLHPNLRIVFMSATSDAQLYQQYFADLQPNNIAGDLPLRPEVTPLFVGTLRCPVEILYLEDLLASGGDQANPVISNLLSCCQSDSFLSSIFVSAQHDLAVHIIRTIVELGTAVLVFVAGIAEIDDFISSFEGLDRYRLVCIHSQIPLEEQQKAFEPASPDAVTVILATNAAESSITLPAVDTVICLGRQNVKLWNNTSHRVELVSTLISQASATQRAGRTGRIRPGRVLRLYKRSLFETFKKHEESEVSQAPLHDLVIKLRGLLEGATHFNGATPILERLPDPPALENLPASFEYLYRFGLVTHPSDNGALTLPGRILSQLGVDMHLGRFLIHGIMLGIKKEAIIIAAALQLPRSPLLFPSPYAVRHLSAFNVCRQKAFLTATQFDEGSYSEPIMLLNAYLAWTKVPRSLSREWCLQNSLDAHVMSEWGHSVDILQTLVHETCGAEAPECAITKPDLWNLIRVCLVWCGENNLLKTKPLRQKSKSESNRMTLESKDSLGLSRVLGLIPTGWEYLCLELLPTYAVVLPMTRLNMQAFVMAFSVFSLAHSFRFTILCCSLNLEERVFFFVPPDEELAKLSRCFSYFDFSQGRQRSLSGGWRRIEFVKLTTSQRCSLSSMGTSARQLRVVFQPWGATAMTNCDPSLVGNLFSEWDPSVELQGSVELQAFRAEVVFCDSNPLSALIPDAPLGIRLFNCLLRGTRDKCGAHSLRLSSPRSLGLYLSTNLPLLRAEAG
jgi:hypothetical protein